MPEDSALPRALPRLKHSALYLIYVDLGGLCFATRLQFEVINDLPRQVCLPSLCSRQASVDFTS